MKNKLLLLSIISLALVGCNREESLYSADTDTQDAKTLQNNNTLNENSNYKSDNTGQNVRDRNTNAMTPMNQSEDATDLAITQEIRKQIVAENLSMNAKNIKIITVGNAVTLRGPVNSEEESQKILEIVKNVKGVKSIDNQLEVSTNNNNTNNK